MNPEFSVIDSQKPQFLKAKKNFENLTPPLHWVSLEP